MSPSSSRGELPTRPTKPASSGGELPTRPTKPASSGGELPARPTKPASRNYLALIAATVLLTAILALALFDLTQEAVAVPIWYVIWLGQLLFQAIPQSLLWALFLTVALVVAVRSLLKRPQPEEESAIEPIHSGQVRVLVSWIQHQEESDYFKRRLAQHLGNLTLEALAYQRRLTLRESRQHLRSLDAPPEIRAYLQAGLTPTPSRPISLASRLLHSLGLRRTTSPLDLDPEIVVQFVERQLGATHRTEIQHDR